MIVIPGTILNPGDRLTRAKANLLGVPTVMLDTEVTAFGAVGDGVVDDTIAITAALTAAGANGVVLFMPGKRYRTTSQITVPQDGMTLLGYGATITSDIDANFQKFKFLGRAGGAVLGLKFSCLYTTAATGLSAGVIEINNSTDVLVKDCRFNDVAKNGVYIFGTSACCKIIDNWFSRNFCAIFSDDDGTHQPALLTIAGNTIKNGIGGSGTAFSGGIKLSGAGSASTAVGHVIGGNVIDSAGQMGIELQTWINGCSITGNTIHGTGWGISLSGVAGGTIAGNGVKGCTNYGIELSASIRTTVSGNEVEGNDASGAQVTLYGIILNSSSSDIVLSGNHVSNCTNQEINIDTSNDVTISGNTTSGHGYNLKDVVGIKIAGNTLIAANAAGYFIFIDSTDQDTGRIAIVNNVFTGAVSANGILLYHPAHNLQDIFVAGNLCSGASAPGEMIGDSGAGTLRRIWVKDNIGTGDQNFQTNIGLEVWSTAGSGVINYAQNTVLVDASGGAATRTLPSAANYNGRSFTVVKSDSSGNAVSVATVLGQNISGKNAAGAYVAATTYSLANQGARLTVKSDQGNWIVTGAA